MAEIVRSLVDIPNYRNLMVSSNELFLRETINRTLEKLIENDAVLQKKINDYGTAALFSILPYREGYVYSRGDVVVFIDEDDGQIKNIYLLECEADGNAEKPSYEIVDGFISDFSKSGWKNLNDFFSIYNSTDEEINLSSFVEHSMSSNFSLSHDDDLKYHKFGEIHVDTISEKLLKKDFSNVDDYHGSPYWSYETKKIASNNFVGYCKKWGCGVLEYDLTYCLGDSLAVEKTIASDGSVAVASAVKVNSLVPLSTSSFDNDDYFLREEDYFVFNKAGDSKRHVVGNMVQTNVTEEVNVYHGTIVFPIPFIDESYMIFTSERTKDADGKAQSPNTVAFTNRQKQSVTAVYAIPNYNAVPNIDELLLRTNVFQCQIIGRWK